jgi:mono/diheme cytochrome c family protein
MSGTLSAILLGIVLTSGIAQEAKAQGAPAPGRSLLDQYCVTCHNDKLKTSGLSLAGVAPGDPSSAATAKPEVFEKVVRKLRSRQMPPEGSPRPDQATIDRFAATLENALDRAAVALPNPGRVASHRLNRAEYVNVIHDLLAVDIDGTELLPSDMAGFGFDNNADVLSITPGLLARYMSAATKVSRIAVGSPDNRPMTQVYRVEFGTKQDQRLDEDMPFSTHGGLAVHHTFPLDGEYVFKLRMQRNQTVGTIEGLEEDVQQIELRVDHGLVKRFRIGGEFKGPDPGVLIAVPESDVAGQRVHNYRLNADRELEIRIPVKAGTRLVTAGFTNSLPSPSEDIPRPTITIEDGDVGIDVLEISGPFNGKTPEDSASRKRIFTCRPVSAREEEPCAHKIIGTLARLAYRRPVTEREIEPLIAIYKMGRSDRDFDAGIERGLEALLSSPKFLIRTEREPADVKPGTVYRLSDLELASRLSFFLWRSVPDEELLGLAEQGKLSDPTVLEKQVHRMLADRRLTRFLDDFVEQWLQVRNIHSRAPDRRRFPDFDPTLREAMARETELFFEDQVREDRPLTELLSANYTFLNERLARHYGINNIYGSHFRRVTLTDDRRFGLLGQASILTVSSYEDRTSVVLRGQWILANLLGSPPPPPPPGVPPLKESGMGAKATALRERMEEHRANPVCASCHATMDPLGFALEHFDAVGRWRETDGGAPINSTIQWSGVTVDSLKEFRAALLSRGYEFNRTVTEKLMTYALGRGIDLSDAPTVRQIGRDLSQTQGAQSRDCWSTLIADIAKSSQFQMRRAPVKERPAASAVAGNR